MLRAKLAGRLNYPGSLHLNGWMSSALARRTGHQFKKRRRSKQEILSRWGWTLLWADLVQHCPAPPKQFSSVPLLKSSFHTEPSLPAPPFSTIHWESAFRLPALPTYYFWDINRQQCHEEHFFRAFLSLLPAASPELWHHVRSSLKWGILAEPLQLSSNLPVPAERGQEPTSLTWMSSSSLTCLACETEVTESPWESLGMKVNPFSISNSFYGNN